MSQDLFKNEKYKCKDNIFRRKINCEYWSVDTNTCKPSCSLKQISPPDTKCFVCKERKKTVDVILQPLTIEATSKYLKAETSQIIQGKVSEEIFEKRKNICLSCDKMKNIQPESESIGWCTACGCGWKSRAALSKKLHIPTLQCPLEKFGQEIGTGFNLKSAVESISGIATSIKETIIDKDK